MPIPLDQLWQPSPRDIVSSQWGVIYELLTTIANNTTVLSPAFSPTEDQTAFITGFSVSAIPGGIIAPSSITVDILNSAGIPLAQLFQDNFVGGAGNLEARGDLGIDLCLVGQRHSIQATAGFTGADPGNQVLFSVMGYAAPKGNASLF